MKRLIRECRKCQGDGLIRVPDAGGEDYMPCHACNGRGQTGEDVRIMSLKPSIQLELLARANLSQCKLFDAVAAPTAMLCDGTTGPATTPFTIVNTGTGACINQVPQGIADAKRIG